MCDFQYHMEALRKQAVIDRKKAMEARQQATMQPQYDPLGRDNTSYGAGPQQRSGADKQASASQPPYAWHQVERELRRQEKVLRDHNLYLGPMDSFQQQYHDGDLPVRRN